MERRTGKVLRIEKASIHDGDGLRTVVFMKGCPLRCQWCSTPESQSIECMMDYGYDATPETILDKGIMPSEKVLDFPVDCNTLTGSVNL